MNDKIDEIQWGEDGELTYVGNTVVWEASPKEEEEVEIGLLRRIRGVGET